MKALTKGLVALTALIGAVVVTAAPAQARLFFGTGEHLRTLQDVTAQGPGGERLYLGYKYSFHSFFLPYRVTNDGYVLGIHGQSQSYFRLDASRIKAMQSQGLLPTPLPPYALSSLDYIMGYSLWPAIILIGFLGLRQMKSRASETASA